MGSGIVPSVRARLTAAAAIVVLLGSCTTSPSPSPSSAKASGPPAGPTQWQAALSGIADDGTVDVHTATTAFSLAIATLPGVTLPDGAPPTPLEVFDGGGPVNWLLRDWDQLTADQQQAATALLANLGNPDFGPLGATRHALGPELVSDVTANQPAPTGLQCGIWRYNEADTVATIPKELRGFATYLDRAAVYYAAHLHRDPVKKWAVCMTRPGTMTAATTTRVNDIDGSQTGAPDHCIVNLNDDYFNGGSADSSNFNYELAVAAFRCFLPTTPGYSAATTAPYVEEGITAWAAGTQTVEDAGGVGYALEYVWPEYLLHPEEPLLARSWDAVGFFSQLSHIENVWDFIDPMLGTPDPENAFYLSGARSDAFAGDWAAGYFRDGSRGPDWNITGPGETADTATPEKLGIANDDTRDLSTPALTVEIADATDTADVTYISGTDLRIADVQLDQVFHRDYVGGNDPIPYCTKDGGGGDCTCPPDSPGAKLPVPADLRSPFHVALTGMPAPDGEASGGGAELRGISLDEYCGTEPSPPPEKPKGGKNPCASGCAGSMGDPHLHTIDLQEYDLQAAGEYTLLRSADGAFEIQARMAPYPDIPDASINTALAWRVDGHRVSMYSHGDSYSLDLDGKMLDASATGTVDLGAGASLTALGDGLEVVSPDGTISTVVFHGNGFTGALDLEIATSDSLAQQAVGLLGRIGKGSELPALADGSVLAKAEDRATRYSQRYQQLAPSWHVTAQTSLFDYGPGESTTNFDNPGFPSPDVAFNLDDLKAREQAAAGQAATDECNPMQGDPNLYTACIYDVLATSDPTFVGFYEQVKQFLIDGPTALDVCGPPVAPAGFAVVPCDQGIDSAVVAPDGSVDIATHDTHAVVILRVDPQSGNVERRIEVASNATVAIAAGSLWVGSSDYSGGCVLQRLDPLTFKRQASITVPCQSLGASFVATSSAVWVVDGSTLRPVVLGSNTLANGIQLPLQQPTLLATGEAIYASDPNANPPTWYRLGASDQAFSQVGQLPGFSQPIAGGGGLWVDDGGALKKFTTSATPDATVAADPSGTLVAADDKAVYLAKDDVGGKHFELWRYPVDGSAGTSVASNNLSFEITLGTFNMSYGTSKIVFGAGKAVILFDVPKGLGEGPTSIYVQMANLPTP